MGVKGRWYSAVGAGSSQLELLIPSDNVPSAGSIQQPPSHAVEPLGQQAAGSGRERQQCGADVPAAPGEA